MTSKIKYQAEMSAWLAKYVSDILSIEIDSQDDMDPEVQLSKSRRMEVYQLIDRLDKIVEGVVVPGTRQ